MGGRRRNIFVLLFVLGLVIVSAIVVVKKPTQLGLDLQGGIELTLQGRPTPQIEEVTSEAMERSVDIIRSGCDKLGVSEIEVSRLGADQISVGIPGATNVGTATECATKPARLYFYDWQNNLVGPAMEMDPRTGADADTTEVRREVAKRWKDAGRPIGRDFNSDWIAQGAEPTVWDAVNLAEEQPRDEDCEDCTSGDRFYLFEAEEPHELISGPTTAREDLFFDNQGRPIPHEPAPGSKGGNRVVFEDENGNPTGEGIVKKVPQGSIVVKELPSDESGKTIQVDRDGLWKNSKGEKVDPAGYFVINDTAALSGSEIKDPQQSLDEFNQPNVTFEFTGEGRDAFQEITRTIAQEGQARAPGAVSSEQASGLSGNFAIVLDGQVVSRPIINFVDNPDGIDGRQGAQISGGFTVDEAQRLAEYLQRGALPIDLTLTSQSKVSATLGKEALDQGVLALLIGLACVIVFLITFYRFLGGVASLALIVYAILFLALIKVIPITLTLPGIAGLVLTIGVAADSNIVIFERVKEEMRAGKSVQSAITLGYRRGISTIIDANVVTLLTAFILFVLATSGIKGFAFTLGVGTLVSLLTAVVFTQALLGSMSNTKLLRSGRGFSGIEGKERWHLDFMGKAPVFFAISGVILLIGAGALTAKGLNFGIDFKSGTRVEVSLKEPATTDQVRDVISPFGLGDADIQEITDNPELGDHAFKIESDAIESRKQITVNLEKPADPEQIRQVVSQFGLEGADINADEESSLGDNAFTIESDSIKDDSAFAEEVETALDQRFGVTTNTFTIGEGSADASNIEQALNDEFGVEADGFNSTTVGPTFGASVARSAGLAIFFSLILIMGYIAVRFGSKYTVPVLIAIVHDFLIALGIYALLGFEVSSATVAAFLTILGYSQYDTIIVFDRIRENEPKMPRATYSQIVNKSVSEVMTRSLVTSFSTLIGVVALLIFGGEVLQAFAIAILVGVFSGTYSSIFIASPVLALWKEHEPGFKRRRRQQIESQGHVPAFASDIEVARKGDEPEPKGKAGGAPALDTGKGN